MAETRLAPSTNASVVLDIGGDIGALVVEMPSDLNGAELDLIAVGATQALMHTEVRERHVDGGVRYAAVYASVPAGRYRVEGSTDVVSITGGEVTQMVYAKP